MDKERRKIVPKVWLAEEEMEDKYKDLKVLYGAFALSIWRELVRETPEMPNIVLTVADNWFMITLCAAPPRSSLEKLVTESGIYITESSDILKRNLDTQSGIFDIVDILKATQTILEARNIASNRVIVLDRTSVAYRNQVFDFKEGKIIDSRGEPMWGGVVRLINPDMEVYIITHGYKPKDEDYLRDLTFGKDLPDPHYAC